MRHKNCIVFVNPITPVAIALVRKRGIIVVYRYWKTIYIYEDVGQIYFQMGRLSH